MIKNSYILFVLVLVLTAIAQSFTIWWSIIPVCFALGFISELKGLKHFYIGFLALFLQWAIMTLWVNQNHGGTMDDLLGQLFGGIPGIGVILAGSFLAGMLGGLSVLSGHFGRQILN